MKIKFLLSPIAYKVDEKLREAKEYLGRYINLEESEDPDAIILLTGGTEEEALKYLKDGLFIIPFGKANGIAASLEVQAYAKEKGIKTILITKLNENIMNILKVLDEFKNKKVGIKRKENNKRRTFKSNKSLYIFKENYREIQFICPYDKMF